MADRDTTVAIDRLWRNAYARIAFESEKGFEPLAKTERALDVQLMDGYYGEYEAAFREWALTQISVDS